MSAQDDRTTWLDAGARLTVVELAECAGVNEMLVRELVEYGALEPARPGELVFSAEYAVVVRRAARLCQDLELETPAVALVVSFLQRIQSLEGELRRLEARRGAREPR
jgi:chaperone modulatory protein CbpM